MQHWLSFFSFVAVFTVFSCGGEPAERQPPENQPTENQPEANTGGEAEESGAGSGGEGAGSDVPKAENGGSDLADNDRPGSGEMCAAEERIGSFRLYLGEDRTIFSGAVSNGITPRAIPEVIDEVGSCRLLGPRDLFCSEGCASGETCAGEDTCVPVPENVSAGSVSVVGANEPIELEPNGITLGYSASLVDSYPGFNAGSPIHLSAGGDVTEPFEMNAVGVSPMNSAMDVVAIQRGSAVSLQWEPADVPETPTEIYINFTLNTHGTLLGWLECTTEDTGEFTVPEPLLAQLIELGLSGFPRATLGRRSSDTAALDAGCVDLSVSSEVTLDLELEGLTSCNSDEDCPSGQACSPELACTDQ